MVWWGFRALKTPERALFAADALRRLAHLHPGYEKATERLQIGNRETTKRPQRNSEAAAESAWDENRRGSPRTSGRSAGEAPSAPPACDRGEVGGRRPSLRSSRSLESE